MAPLILSGVGGSTNWLPLLLPLVGILLLVKAAEAAGKYLKKRKLLKENKLVDELISEPKNEINN